MYKRQAMVGAPVVNQESFFGSSDIGMWFAPYQLGGALVLSLIHISEPTRPY